MPDSSGASSKTSRPVPVRQLLQEASRQLASVSETPYLDAVLLLAHSLGISREKILASYPDPVSPSLQLHFQGLLKRRLTGEPAAYILGTKEFWGLPFQVDPRVLTPRPDTETLVEAALGILSKGANPGCRVHEVGTGSGCIAVSLKYERPDLELSASDISPQALALAQHNTEALLPPGTRLPLVQADLLRGMPLPGPWDMIISNPPYLTAAEMEEKRRQGWPEPLQALDGGPDGLDLIRQLIEQAEERLASGGFLLLEADPRQMPLLEELFRGRNWTETAFYPDLTGRDRSVSARRP